MATDIIKANISEDITNGSMIFSCGPTGEHYKFTRQLDTLTIESLESKYEDRFKGAFPVQLYGNQIIVGG
jgi:hypothetical protein